MIADETNCRISEFQEITTGGSGRSATPPWNTINTLVLAEDNSDCADAQLVLLIVWLAPLHIHSVFELITSGSVYCRQIPSHFSLFSPALSPFPFIRKKELRRRHANCARRRRRGVVFFRTSFLLGVRRFGETRVIYKVAIKVLLMVSLICLLGEGLWPTRKFLITANGFIWFFFGGETLFLIQAEVAPK